MPKKIKISVSSVHGKDKKFTGRLIGVVDDKECRAIINMVDAARRISTAESVKLGDLKFLADGRFVIVTTDYSGNQSKEIFISPKINYTSYHGRIRTMHCKGGDNYDMEEV